MIAHNKFQESKSKKNNSIVVQILCGQNHIYSFSDGKGQQRSSRVEKEKQKNLILGFIKKELNLDHFYEKNEKIVLVRIDEETIMNPVISEMA